MRFKKILICTLTVISLSMSILSPAAAETLFYQNPSQQYLQEKLKEFVDAIKDSSDDDKKYNIELLEVYLAQIFKEHPTLVPKSEQNNITKTFKSPFSKNIESLKKLEPKVPHHLDLLWASFFTTGDNIYLKKILEVATQDCQALFAAYKVFNRQNQQHAYLDEKLEKEVKEIAEKVFSSPSFKQKYVLASAAYSSLTLNIAEHTEEIGDRMVDIINQNIRLNYLQILEDLNANIIPIQEFLSLVEWIAKVTAITESNKSTLVPSSTYNNAKYIWGKSLRYTKTIHPKENTDEFLQDIHSRLTSFYLERKKQKDYSDQEVREEISDATSNISSFWQTYKDQIQTSLPYREQLYDWAFPFYNNKDEL